VGWLFKTALESITGLIPNFSLRPGCYSVNSTGLPYGILFTLGGESVFRSLFKKKPAALTGAPTVRRLKIYSAQSGYVYQYYYEGHREALPSGEIATEFVFAISADRKNWHSTSVLVHEEAVRVWEAAHERQLSSTERYAVAKMALFQAFDERAEPSLMKGEVRVRAADIEAIVETLEL
jgi:hypothetical protein